VGGRGESCVGDDGGGEAVVRACAARRVVSSATGRTWPAPGLVSRTTCGACTGTTAMIVCLPKLTTPAPRYSSYVSAYAFVVIFCVIRIQYNLYKNIPNGCVHLS
jgi:hypothetical protein